MKRVIRVLFVVLLFYISVSAQKKAKPFLVDFKSSECDNTVDVSRLKPRIVRQGFEGNLFVIEVGTKATCCVEFIPSISMTGDTLSLNLEETGQGCECECCYQFIYKISNLAGKNFGINLQGIPVAQSDEKYVTFPPVFDLVNGDTVNYIDKYGMRQGHWFKTKENGSYFKAFAIDDVFSYYENVSYNDSARLKSLVIRSNANSSHNTFYYKDGSIKSQRTENKDFNEHKEFYEDGTLKIISISGVSGLDLWREYYPNRQVYKERFFSHPERLMSKYYYDTGELLAEYFLRGKETDFSEVSEWRCYDKSGKPVDCKTLRKIGLLKD